MYPPSAMPKDQLPTRAPVNTQTPTGTFDCNFDTSGFCGWSQDTTDQFDWTITSGTTMTSGTGPTGDHTQADGS